MKRKLSELLLTMVEYKIFLASGMACELLDLVLMHPDTRNWYHPCELGIIFGGFDKEEYLLDIIGRLQAEDQ